MKPSVLIGISWCGTHNKGDERSSLTAIRYSPEEHLRWLAESVDLHASVANSLGRPSRVVVTASGYPSILQVPAGPERLLYWEVMERVTFLAHPENLGHQRGAALCIRLGLEAAGYWGYRYYLHTAEDVIPRPGAAAALLEDLDGGLDYASQVRPEGSANCTFFAARVAPLAARFDIHEVRHYQGLEQYLWSLVRDGRHSPVTDEHHSALYQTTHDHAEYRRWLSDLPSGPVPMIRTMSDYDRR
jgi:hypothetical protein